MPSITPDQRKRIQSSFREVFNGDAPSEAVEKGLSELLPEGSDPFKFDMESKKDGNIASFVKENLSKFEKTAPDYTPPESAFTAFESSIEALAAKAAPASEGPKTGDASSGPSNSAGSNETPEKKGPPDFDKEATLEWMGVAA